jgi:hypothetical protein
MNVPGINLKIKAGELAKNKLFVATPMFGGGCAGMFARSIADLSSLCTHYGVQLQLFFLFNESLITRARNYIADEFMRSEAVHLMFIDADIGFDSRDVIALMALQIQNPDTYDIIGGCYPKKCISWEKVVQAVNKGVGEKNPNDLEKYVGDFVFNPVIGTKSIPLASPVEVLEIGTGFMMVRKSVMQKFVKTYPQYHYRPDHVRTEHFDGSREILQFFQAEIDQIDFGIRYKELLDNIVLGDKEGDLDFVQHQIKEEMKKIEEDAKKMSKRYLSEDYWFSKKCHEMGIKTWLCPWMRLQHMGSYVFGGSLIELAQVGAAATADESLLAKNKKNKKVA